LITDSPCPPIIPTPVNGEALMPPRANRDEPMRNLDQFFDAYERATPPWLSEALAAAMVAMVVLIVVV
jgi:hypothetical protein